MPGAPQHQRHQQDHRRQREDGADARTARVGALDRGRSRSLARRLAEFGQLRPGGGDQATQARLHQPIQEPRGGHVARATFLDPELLSPGDERTPQELVEGHHHHHHRHHRPDLRGDVALIGRDAHVGAEAGQAEILVAELERLAERQEEPAAGHAHHAVPHQTEGRERQLDRTHLLPAAEAEDARGLALLVRHGLQRAVEAEGHVPGLAGEDHDHRGELQAGVAVREQRDQRDHQPGHETEHRDALQDVEHRHEDALGAPVLRRPVAVGEREEQRDQVGEQPAHQRLEGVPGQHPWREIDLDLGTHHAVPLAGDMEDAVEEPADACDQQQVGPHGWQQALRRERTAPHPLDHRCHAARPGGRRTVDARAPSSTGIHGGLIASPGLHRRAADINQSTFISRAVRASASARQPRASSRAITASVVAVSPMRGNSLSTLERCASASRSVIASTTVTTW